MERPRGDRGLRRRGPRLSVGLVAATARCLGPHFPEPRGLVGWWLLWSMRQFWIRPRASPDTKRIPQRVSCGRAGAEALDIRMLLPRRAGRDVRETTSLPSRRGKASERIGGLLGTLPRRNN